MARSGAGMPWRGDSERLHQLLPYGPESVYPSVHPVLCACVTCAPTRRWVACTGSALLELLFELVDALIRHTQPSASLGSGDRILTVEARRAMSTSRCVPLAGDQLNMLGDSVSEAEDCLLVDSRPQAVEPVEQEPSIGQRPAGGDVVDGGVTFRQVARSPGAWPRLQTPCPMPR